MERAGTGAMQTDGSGGGGGGGDGMEKDKLTGEPQVQQKVLRQLFHSS